MIGKKIKTDEMLWESNKIEGEYRDIAYKDAIKAWRYIFIRRDRLNLQIILRTHYLMFKNINPKIAGFFRNCDVWIGGKQKHFISENFLRDELVGWLKLYDRLKSGDEKEAHIIFESIHPFEDGNGRIGRILYNIHRINKGNKIKIIHAGDEQIEYYKWFK